MTEKDLEQERAFWKELYEERIQELATMSKEQLREEIHIVLDDLANEAVKYSGANYEEAYQAELDSWWEDQCKELSEWCQESVGVDQRVYHGEM